MHHFRLNKGWQPFIKLNLLILSVLVLCTCKTESTKKPALIPLPQVVEWNDEVFNMTDSSACFVQRLVTDLPGVPLHMEEAYRLNISADSVILEATTPKGLYWGQQTIRQIKQTHNGHTILQGCKIIDWPAFSVRGFMQDVGRNFQPMDMLKEQIDVLAAYKFNVFHFHMTENPGWRLESKIYPQLNSPESMTRRKGEYYTQEDFKELVNYCRDREITLIPEFDIPGHSAAFRRAMGFKEMSDPRVQPVLIDLVDELCSLAPAKVMPYIHLGTDEVWHSYEEPSPTLLPALLERVTRYHKRELIVWRPGQEIEGDSVSITQLWSSNGHPKPGHRYIDCRLNYLNHLDPLAGVVQLYFDRISGAAHGDSLRMGGILCCWNDNKVYDPYDILAQNPVYPGIVTYSETSWKGQSENTGDKYLAKFPPKESTLFDAYCAFENRLIEHRDRYFSGKPFPYIKQTNIEWSIIGPFDNEGDVSRAFPVENEIKAHYQIDSTAYEWKKGIVGGTIHLQHFFAYPSYYPKSNGTFYAFTRLWSPQEQTVGAWIGFHDWSRSGGRRGGPFPEEGEWHNTDPKIWVNNRLIAPPRWNNLELKSNTLDTPFTDENYFFREPQKVHLKKGWNEILIKIPIVENTWKRMFTFVPVAVINENVREVPGLKFNAEIN